MNWFSSSILLESMRFYEKNKGLLIFVKSLDYGPSTFIRYNVEVYLMYILIILDFRKILQSTQS